MLAKCPVVEKALPPNAPPHRNPFLLDHNLDDVARLVVPPILDHTPEGGVKHAETIQGLELLRLRRASRLLLAEETLRGSGEAEASGALAAAATRVGKRRFPDSSRAHKSNRRRRHQSKG